MRSKIRPLLVLLALLASACGPVGAQAGLSEDHSYVASSRGEVYYPRSCEAWRDLSRRNLVGFESEEEARAAGYRRTTSRSCAGPALSEAAARELAESGVCVIEAVSDGDTVRCRDGRRIRLLLIDTPELSQAPYGREARDALTRLLPIGSPARVELDVEVTDRYGRTLAYLYDPEGRMVNEEMARLGFALRLTYPPNVRHVERIGEAVDEAREARRGLWSGSAFECSPRDHRAGAC